MLQLMPRAASWPLRRQLLALLVLLRVTAVSCQGARYAAACSVGRSQQFLSVWAEKTKCWLCENITKAVVEQSVFLLHDELMAADLPVTEDNMLTAPWFETCLPAFVLAMLATTRGSVLQPWKIYEFGLNILWSARFNEVLFFEDFGVTPSQIAYVFGLVGHKRFVKAQMLELQEAERKVGSADASIWDLPLVVDVGMGLGGDARYYLQQGFRVVGIEANPAALDAATTDDTLAVHLKTGQLTMLNAAVAGPESKETHLRFFVLPKRPEQSKALEWIVQDGGKEVSVRTMQCADILKVFGQAMYMKVDVEFNTVDCLLSLQQEAKMQRASGRQDWRPPQMLSLELEAADLIDSFYEVAKELGYSHYKACRQFMYSTGPCETGSYSSVVPGCGSGPFGQAAVDYIAGPLWRELEELPSDRGFVKEFSDGFDWFDIHFKLPD
eukprot:TRINITY_DN60130_c0_g1_i1.p1 TRINITY_DN60130_c0_g1~~TRINITY_DN60130_c0_g1_i1.p1  ORF type:complete len:440 (-),score=125.66 TRINITY_DN60130_c0_g1_i1:394-1713(-)